MTRVAVWVLAGVLVSAPLLHAQRGGAGRGAGGEGRGAPANQPARGNGEGRGDSAKNERQAKLKQLQDERKQLDSRAKGLQDALKRDRQSRNQAAIDHDTEALRSVREELKRNADEAKALRSQK